MRIVVGGADRIAPAEECSAWLHKRLRAGSLESCLTPGITSSPRRRWKRVAASTRMSGWMHRRSIAGRSMSMSQHPLRNSFRRCDQNWVRYFISSFPRKRESRATYTDLAARPGFPEFTNEVQHLSKVLQWESNMSTCHWMNGAGLPVFMKTGNPSAKSRQLWIARHRRFLAS